MTRESRLSLGHLRQLYDVLLCDIWGVIHNGRQFFPRAVEALYHFRKSGGIVLLISNAPRLTEDIIVQLRTLGIPEDTWDDIVTSGDVTRSALKHMAPGPAFIIGPERDLSLYEGLGLELAGPETAAFVLVSGLVHDDTEGPENYREVLELAAKRHIPMVCANPDRVVKRGEHLIYCAGALAELYENMGEDVIIAGKPHAPIYDLAFQKLHNIFSERKNDKGFDRKRILAIGDGLPTDIKGANLQGLDCLFITSGIHDKPDHSDQGLVFGEQARDRQIKDAGFEITYSLSHLFWSSV